MTWKCRGWGGVGWFAPGTPKEQPCQANCVGLQMYNYITTWITPLDIVHCFEWHGFSRPLERPNRGYCPPTNTSTSALVNLPADDLQPLNADFPSLHMVHQVIRVVFANNTVSSFLYLFGCCPRLVDVLGRHGPQLRYIFPKKSINCCFYLPHC